MTKQTMPTLASVISPFPYHIDYMSPIAEARSTMEEHSIRHLVVLSDGDIYGLLSERDIQHHSALYGSDECIELKINDICSNNAVVADIHDPLDRVLEAMGEKQLGSVVVLRDGELAGIFTTTDACKHYAKHLKEHHGNDEIPDIIA